MALLISPVLFVTAILFLVYKLALHPALLSPLAKIPNAHWSVPFSRLWVLSIRFNHKENRTLQAAHRRLGPVIRVAPNELSIDDTDSLRTVYQGGFEKPSWYSVFDNYGVPCMFSTRSSREHSLRKRMISNVYSKSYIQASGASSEQAHIILFDRLIPILKASGNEASASHGLDVHSTFLAATMDFISAYIFGIQNSTNFLDNEPYREHWLDLYKSRNDYGIYDQELPLTTSVCRKLGIPFCPKWVDSANQELGKWCIRLCAATFERLSTTEPKAKNLANEPVVMSALLSGLEKEEAIKGEASIIYETAIKHHELSVASELFDHVLAGQETAGVTLTYLTWRLSQSESLQRELKAELLGLEPSMQLRDDGTASLPDPKQLDGLPILHAVMMETLRLHAPIPGPQPRQSPFPSSQLGAYHVPGGVRVAALAHTLHRNERVFPDPERWDHTRWLAAGVSEEERKERNRHFWAFGSGGRMCIGSNFAVQEMKLIVAAIYSNFTTHIVDDDGVADQGDGYTARPSKERLYLRFESVK